MKVDDAIQSLARFFNDLIGSLVPGIALAFGLCLMHVGPSKSVAVANSLDGAVVGLMTLGLLFAVGHGLLAFYEHVLQKALWSCGLTRMFDVGKAEEKWSYKSFLRLIEAKEKEFAGTEQALIPQGYHDVRSAALTVSAEGSSLGRRFMFISLLCNGVGTAVVLLTVDFIACLAFGPRLLYPYANSAPWAMQIALLLLFSGVLFKRGEIFFGRAMTTPFSIAVAEIKLVRPLNERE